MSKFWMGRMARSGMPLRSKSWEVGQAGMCVRARKEMCDGFVHVEVELSHLSTWFRAAKTGLSWLHNFGIAVC